MYLPIFDALLGLLSLGAESASKKDERQALIATLTELEEGLSTVLLDEKARTGRNPALHNASSAFFCHARVHRSNHLEPLAAQLERLLGALQVGQAGTVQVKQLQAAVKGQLALLS